jgi:hypothetical protein
MRRTSVVLMLALGSALASGPAVGDDAKDGIDAEGYVCAWLVLAPIPFKAGQHGADALDDERVKDEPDLKPAAGDKLKVGEKELTWTECLAKDQILDVNGLLGKQTENSAAYAVAYITADADRTDLTLALGSDDQIKVYLNGKQIHSYDEGRPLEKDEDSVAGLSLKKGLNVLVVKIINEEEDWAVSARFLDKDGKPVGGLKATTRRG